jgi:mRNA-degrading endonuclease RelE of RelBE toxin-antitoxin system
MAVVFRETALHALADIRSNDKEAFLQIRRTLAGLADEPRPDNAVGWGGTGVFRLHAGNARILYEVDEETSTIYIINIGRIS